MEMKIEEVFRLALYKKMDELKEVFEEYIIDNDMDFQLLSCENDINKILSLFDQYNKDNKRLEL